MHVTKEKCAAEKPKARPEELSEEGAPRDAREAHSQQQDLLRRLRVCMRALTTVLSERTVVR